MSGLYSAILYPDSKSFCFNAASALFGITNTPTSSKPTALCGLASKYGTGKLLI